MVFICKLPVIPWILYSLIELIQLQMRAIMKNSLLVLLLFCSVVAYSQGEHQGKMEIYAGYGIATAQDIVTGISNTLGTALLPGMVKRIDISGGGALFAGVDYNITNRVTLGLQGNYASYDQTYRMDDESTSTLEMKYVTLMGHSRISWVNKSFFQLYSALGAGVTMIRGTAEDSKKDTHGNFAFQVSPVGVRVGNHIAFFVEAGIGFQGILSAGLSVRF